MNFLNRLFESKESKKQRLAEKAEAMRLSELAEAEAAKREREAAKWRVELDKADQEMVKKLIQLAQYFAQGGYSKDNPELVNEVMEIGRKLDNRGGISEMRRIFAMVPPMQGKRTVEMQWSGIGSWRG